MTVAAVGGAILSVVGMIASAEVGRFGGLVPRQSLMGLNHRWSSKRKPRCTMRLISRTLRWNWRIISRNCFTANLDIRPVIYADKEYVTVYGPEVRGQMKGVATFLFSEIESIELQKADDGSEPDLNLFVQLSVKIFRGGSRETVG